MKRLIHGVLIGVALAQLHGCAATLAGGAAAGTAVALDRRTTGVFVGDQEIELRAMARLREAFAQKPASISTTSFNRQVLLTGQVADEAARTQATEIVKGVPEVRTVFNELSVSGPTLVATGASDTALTGKVKTRLLRSERVPGANVKVVSEAGVVYLMGLVTESEAREATEIARTTAGVAKVVILFEYIK